MSRIAKRKKRDVTRQALKAMHRNLSQVMMIGIVELLARLLALAPLVILTLQSGKGAAGFAGLVLSIALYVGLVIPLRSWGGESLRRIFFSRNQPKRTGLPYRKWLLTGLLRHARGLLWGLPFMICLGYFVIGYGTLPVTDMWRPVQNLPTLLGMEASLKTGIFMVGALMLLLAALFAYGWWRDMPVEYLPSRSLGAVKTIHWARRMRQHHGRVLMDVTLINILLALPAAVAFLALLIPYMRDVVDASGAVALTNSIRQLTNLNAIPRDKALIAICIFFLLYLPLCMLRKMRSAAAVAQLMKSRTQTQGSSGAAG